MTPLSCPPGLPLLLLRARPFHHIWVFCLAGGVTVILEGQAWFWTSKREHFQYGKALLACKKKKKDYCLPRDPRNSTVKVMLGNGF